MKITEVRLRPVAIQQTIGVLEPAWDLGGTMTFQRGGGAIVEVVTDTGLVGIGPGVKGRVLTAARAVLIGRDPLAIDQHFGELQYRMGDSRGMAGIDIALWDLRGKHLGQPLHVLWSGGRSRDRVPAYASLVRLSTPAERADLAVQLQQQGWRALKLRLHHESIARDLETVARVRHAVGPEMAILVDANQAQSIGDWQPGVRWDFPRALQTARELEQLGCQWLEEPLPRYAHAELEQLALAVALPIAGGENNRLHEFGPMLAARVFDIVQPDAMVVDGLTGLLRIGELTQRLGVPCAPHHGGRGLGTIAHLHAVAAWPHAPFVEILHDPPIGDCAHGFAMLRNPPVLDAMGSMLVPMGPGLGVDVDPALLGDPE